MLGSERSLPVRGKLERRPVVLGTSGLLAAAVLVLTLAVGPGAEGLTVLYAIPVALLALELGTVAGVIAGAAAPALAAVTLLTRAHPPSAGWVASEAVALLFIGAVGGRFSDRMQEARRQQRRLLNIGIELASRSERGALPGLLLRRAMEVVPAQGMKVTIEGAPTAQSGSVGGDRLTLALRAGKERLGTLVVAFPKGRTFTPDELLALELMAVQATVAAANERSVALERAQIALSSELTAAQDSLADQGKRLEYLLEVQEAERAGLAHELHEQAAQALAAIQIELRAVERDVRSDLTRAHVVDLRERLSQTLQMLRTIAVELRPPALDELGLEPALRGVGRRATVTSGHEIVVEVESVVDRLPAPLETAVYRLVDDIASSLRGPSAIRVRVEDGNRRLRIEARSAGADVLLPPELRARIRSRLDLIAGTLSEERDVLVASIPLSARA